MEQVKLAVKNGIGTMLYTMEEIKEELDDLNFLRDAFLIILNEKVAGASDIPFTKAEVLEYAKEMYKGTNYSNEFIEECFTNKL